jgi:hypothetical protein
MPQIQTTDPTLSTEKHVETWTYSFAVPYKISTNVIEGRDWAFRSRALHSESYRFGSITK